MAAPLVQLRDIALTFGGTPLLEAADLAVSAGERVCLVGRNGSGKSTLLKIAAGLIESDKGSRFVDPGATIRYLPQEPDFSGAATTFDYVMSGLAPGDDPHQARSYLDQLGLTGEEDPAHLSGGESRRAALARVLAPAPDILLLDEPTNHLDLTTIEWLEKELKGLRSALVIISHDRRFLQNLSRTTVWLDRGRTRRLEIGFSQFETRRDEILAEEELEQHKLGRKIVAEEHWVRYGVTARRKRNVKRMADLQTLRQEKREHRGAAGKAVIAAVESGKSGALVIEANEISKTYGERKIVDEFSTRIFRADRLGIVGPNGSGKTTLLGMLTGTLAPDQGKVKLGANLQMATLDQSRDSLDPNWTLKEALTSGTGDTVTIGTQTKHVIGYMKDFLFSPEQIGTPLSALSGGERGRVMLARALAKPSNLLVLDEPTNDLDIDTLELLEELLEEYKGTVFLVSHDRTFLDNVVTQVIVAEGNGMWREYIGGYSDWERVRPATTPAGAPKGAAKPDAKTEAVSTQAAPAVKQKKLSYKEQREMDALPVLIAQLEEEQKAITEKLADAGIYTKQPDEAKRLNQRFAEIDGLLLEALEKWEVIEARGQG